jgi:hypothetical protein
MSESNEDNPSITKVEDEVSSSTWNEFDEYTLTLMSNRSQYSKYIKAKVGPNGETVSDNVNDGHSIHYATTFKKEKKYYKKRILALTKELFNKKHEEDKDITEPFQEYLKYCIKYLKFKDISEMIQSDYKDIRGGENDKEIERAQFELNKRIETDTRGENNTNDHEKKAEAEGETEEIKESNEMKDANDKFVTSMNPKKLMKPYTLDNYVKIKPAGELYTHPKPKPMILPQIKEFNIEMMNNAEKKQKKIKKEKGE